MFTIGCLFTVFTATSIQCECAAPVCTINQAMHLSKYGRLIDIDYYKLHTAITVITTSSVAPISNQLGGGHSRICGASLGGYRSLDRNDPNPSFGD